MNPDRIVVGASEPEDGERVVGLHAKLETEVLHMDVASAELVKLAANAFLSTRVSFINEIANVCELVGADVVDVARGVGLDHRLGPHFLKAGIGFGGSCFPKDVTALKQLAGNSGYPFLLLQAVWEVNELQKRRVVQKLQQRLGSLRGRTVALLGLAFKPNTDDMREAPSRVIACRACSPRAPRCAAGIRSRGPTTCRASSSATRSLDAVRGADAAVSSPSGRSCATCSRATRCATRWRGRSSSTGSNLLDPAAVVAAGFEYEAIGRPTKATPA